MFPTIEVSGAPRERGRIYGIKAKTRIDRSVATYARLFAFCGIDWQGAQKLGAGYRELIGDLDHELLAACRSDGDSELLMQLARRRLEIGFSRLALSSRKLPEATVSLAGRPLTDDETIAVRDHGRDDANELLGHDS